MSTLQCRPRHTRALIAHDWANVLCLPLIFLFSCAGLCGILNPARVTDVFIAYIVADFWWIFFLPQSLPSKPNIILLHHVVTLGLLGFAWVHPEFAVYTCLDGLTEVNTFFMVLRRQTSWGRAAMHKLYWATHVPLRLVMYPALVYVFWRALETHSLAARLLVCTCQVLLCCFNAAVFFFSVRRRLGRRMSLRSSPSDTPRGGVTPKGGAGPTDDTLLQSLKQGKLGVTLRSDQKRGQTNVYIKANAGRGLTQ